MLGEIVFKISTQKKKTFHLSASCKNRVQSIVTLSVLTIAYCNKMVREEIVKLERWSMSLSVHSTNGPV